MDERAQLDGMHFGIEIETVNLCRKDTVPCNRLGQHSAGSQFIET